MPQTRREKITHYLQLRTATARDVATEFGLRVKDAVDELEHVRKSAGPNFKIEAARCRKCEFEFDSRERLGSPSRCPDCKHERIDGPWFWIER